MPTTIWSSNSAAQELAGICAFLNAGEEKLQARYDVALDTGQLVAVLKRYRLHMQAFLMLYQDSLSLERSQYCEERTMFDANDFRLNEKEPCRLAESYSFDISSESVYE